MVLGYQAQVYGLRSTGSQPRQPSLNENDDENDDFLLFVRLVRFVVKKNREIV